MCFSRFGCRKRTPIAWVWIKESHFPPLLSHRRGWIGIVDNDVASSLDPSLFPYPSLGTSKHGNRIELHIPIQIQYIISQTQHLRKHDLSVILVCIKLKGRIKFGVLSEHWSYSVFCVFFTMDYYLKLNEFLQMLKQIIPRHNSVHSFATTAD